MNPKVIRQEVSPIFGEVFLKRLLSGDLSKVVTSFRISPISSEKSIREYESQLLETSFDDFNQWCNGLVCTAESGFCNLPSFSEGLISAYADYKYFSELFDECPVNINWDGFEKKFELPVGANDEIREDQDGLDATLWVGTEHSHTPLHYDSYGYNIVVQLHGTKRWQLWDNQFNSGRNQSGAPSPTRVPYEESSVYSTDDPRADSHHRLQAHDRQQQLRPPDYEFLLQPGDVLFVPHQWWHYVTSVSVTTMVICLVVCKVTVWMVFVGRLRCVLFCEPLDAAASAGWPRSSV